jgi:hypothetical protein
MTMDAFILSLIPQNTDPQIVSAISLVLNHKLAAAIALFFGSSVGLNVLVWLLNRIPLGWWYSLLRSTAGVVSTTGRQRFTWPIWRQFEVAFEDFLGKSVDAIRAGLDADERPDAPKEAETPQGGQTAGPGGDPERSIK